MNIFPSRSRRRPIRAAIACTLFLASLAGAPLTAGTLDRDHATPTAWAWYYGQTPTSINTIRAKGHRIVSLSVESTSPLRFTVAFVRNSGSYARSSTAWYYGTPGFVESKRAGRRVTALAPYVINNRLYLAAAFVANTGSNAKIWGYYYGTLSFLQSKLKALGARIVDLDSYVISGRRYYSAVMVRNAGSDARAWWWYLGVSSTTIASAVRANRARLTDLHYIGSNRYVCVMVRDPKPVHWWWYLGVSAGALNDALAQNGARPIAVQRVGSRFYALMINNSNDLTTRIGDILRGGTRGVTGCYLARVGSTFTQTLCSLNASRVFEPASTLKTLPHFMAMERVKNGSLSLSAKVFTRLGKNGSCPTGGGQAVFQTLRETLRLMMENSDNCRTDTVVNLLKRNLVNARAKLLGMSRTSINHVFGCGGPTPNATTLADLGRLHAHVIRGGLGAQRTTFYDLMINDRTYPTAASTSLDTVIAQEAAKLSLPAEVVALFRSKVVYAAKGGNYDFPSRRSYFGSYFGHLGLPVCSNDKIVMRDYVLGTFFHGAPVKTAGFAAIGKAYVEMARGEIAAALKTFVGVRVFGLAKKFGVGCKGSGGIVSHASTGVPEIGKTQFFHLAAGPSRRLAVLHFGVSRTSWSGLKLPFDLTLLGAPGCRIYTGPVADYSTTTSASGTALFALRHGNDPKFVGARIYTQWLCLDPGANQLGITASNGVDTRIGGLRKR